MDQYSPNVKPSAPPWLPLRKPKLERFFLNGQQSVPIRTSLIEMGHPHPPTTIKIDSATSYVIITHNMRRKRSKSFYMRFH